jgi:hypothetical protein
LRQNALTASPWSSHFSLFLSLSLSLVLFLTFFRLFSGEKIVYDMENVYALAQQQQQRKTIAIGMNFMVQT